MRNEDAFNSFLSDRFKRLRPNTYALKMAEKFHVGIPDFLLLRGGRCVFVESKFLENSPGARSKKALRHEFQGPQISFLLDAAIAGAKCYGVIGLDYTRSLRIVPVHLIPHGGNWPLGAWNHPPKDKPIFWDFKMADFHLAVDFMFDPPAEALP